MAVGLSGLPSSFFSEFQMASMSGLLEACDMRRDGGIDLPSREVVKQEASSGTLR